MNASLYERLGKFEGITKLVDDALDTHLNNPIIKPRFENIEDLDHAKKVAAEFFAMGSGGPEQYSGRDLLTAHRGMNINEQEFIAVVADIMAALTKNSIDETTQKDVLAILFSLKSEVIRV